MYFKDKQCPSCGKNYDPTLEKCPHCETNNDNFVEHNPYKEMNMLPWYWQIIFFALGTAGLTWMTVLLNEILTPIFNNVRDPFWTDDFFAIFRSATLNFVRYGLIFVIALTLLLIFFRKNIFKSFLKWKNCLLGLAFAAGLVLTSILYNVFVQSLGFAGANNNEVGIREITKYYPFWSILIFGLVGPICEELTYRLGLFSFMSRINKVVAYIATALFFGFIHFDFTNIGSALEWIMLPDYIIAGLLLCVAYDKFGLSCSIIAHAGNNLFSIIISVIANSLPQ